MVIFDKLIQIRKEKRVSQGNMAYKLGITSTTLNRYEKGNRKISAELMLEYAIVLGYELKLMVR
jgi:transcriptional regulator with XRE-family HTH domain